MVTITAYYSTGTILVQGTKCLTWVREEFDALNATARAIYALKTTNTSVDANKEVEDELRLLRPPSADRDGSEEASAAVCPPFIGALLRYVRPLSDTPPATDCGSPAAAAIVREPRGPTVHLLPPAKFKYFLELGESLRAGTVNQVSERSHNPTICAIFII